MTSVLILVKHSLPEIDPQAPAHRWSLSEVGRRRCRPLAARLAGHHPDAIVSSREPKAMETARLVAEELGMTFTTAPGLQEHDRSNVVFLSQEELQAAVTAFFAQPDQIVFGKESARQAQRRFVRAISALLDEHRNRNIVVVAHGTVISLYVSHVTGCDPFALWQRLGLPSFVVMSLPGLTVSEVVESLAHDSVTV